MTAEFILRLLNVRQLPRRLSLHVPQCLWVVLYAAIGGGNCLLGLFGLQYFRSSNRYSIWICATCLFFLVSRMSRIVRGWNKVTSYALATGVAAVGLLDQLPLPPPKAETQAMAKLVENDRAFCRKLEEKLFPGTMVFQVPVMNFIDADPINGCEPYAHARPYLWTRTLRFSWGSAQGRTRDDWQALVMKLPIEQQVAHLEQFGFGAIYYNRKAFTNHAETIIKELARLGKTQIIEDDAHELVCVPLSPSLNPTLPHSDDAAQIVYKSGWVIDEVGQEGIRHWANGKSSVYFVNDQAQTQAFHVTGLVAVSSAHRVDIQFGGKTIWSQQGVVGEGRLLDLRLVARPGRNYLCFQSDGRPEPVPGQSQEAVRVAQAVINLAIVKDLPTRP